MLAAALASLVIGHSVQGREIRATRVGADTALARGVNVVEGHVVYGPVAEAHGLPWTDLDNLLETSSQRS